MKQKANPGIIAAAVIGVLVLIAVIYKFTLGSDPTKLDTKDTKAPAYIEEMKSGAKGSAAEAYGQGYGAGKAKQDQSRKSMPGGYAPPGGTR